MNTAPASSIRAWSSQLEGLAEPARLRLLNLLQDRELTVSELAEALRLPQSTTSRHLRTLSDLGWVAHRPEGTARLYRLRNGELPAGLRALWKVLATETGVGPEIQQDRQRLERILLERRSDPKRLFAGLAPRWEELRRELFGERFALEALAALLPEAAEIVDLGCGTGILLERLAPYVRRAIGVDASPEMLALARARLEALPAAELIAAPVERVPAPDQSADAALLLLVLGHLPEPALALKEARRIVRGGGKLVIVDLLASSEGPQELDPQLGRSFSPTSLEELLRSAGWIPSLFRLLPYERGTRGPALFVAVAKKPATQRHVRSRIKTASHSRKDETR